MRCFDRGRIIFFVGEIVLGHVKGKVRRTLDGSRRTDHPWLHWDGREGVQQGAPNFNP
jgi:hypothetical protein